MVSTGAASIFVVLLLSVQVVQSQNGWGVTYNPTKICASNGSTVEMHCTFTYPNTGQVTKTYWCLENDQDLLADSKYKNRIQYNCSEKSCSMTFKDLTQQDSREYWFRFETTATGGKWTGKPGVTLSVTALQVELTKTVRINASYTKADLSCKSSCPQGVNFSYVWLKNGQKVAENVSIYTASFYPDTSICCALKGHENHCSPSLYTPELPSVSVSPSGEIKEGDLVSLDCTSGANPAANYTWYKKSGQTALIPKPQLAIKSIQSSDSGEYYCTAENKLGIRKSENVIIDVKYAPKNVRVSVSPSDEIKEGDSVSLNCISDANPAANYTWYKEEQFKVLASQGLYNFTSISSKDRGSYSCKSENKYGWINASVFIDVKYAPKLPSVSVSPSAEIVEGSTVNLTCSSDANPAANYTWYKENHVLPGGAEGFYQFTSISSGDRGNYYCKSENQHGQACSSWLFLNVQYPPKLPSVSVSPSKIVEGSFITLTCISDANPAANYSWYKDNKESSEALGQNFTITDLSAEQSGVYRCEARNSKGSHSWTLNLVVVELSGKESGTWKAITGTAIAILVVIILIWILLWIWKKRTPKTLPAPSENLDKSAQKQPAEQSIHYASIHISQKQAGPLYSNRPAQAQRYKTEEDENQVQYAVLSFNSAGSAQSYKAQERGEDPATLYNSVSKTLQNHVTKDF